jgi:lipid II:glycine glycyltransferase (peptidoglycan interpeptide bridge formation enzyme)
MVTRLSAATQIRDRPTRISPISPEKMRSFLSGLPSSSFMQNPSWADLKTEWTHELLGWRGSDGRITGSALVLYRRTPLVRRYFAYIPAGPVLDWSATGLEGWLAPLLEHLRARRVFTVRIGPPVVLRCWHADTVRDALARSSGERLDAVRPDQVNAEGLLVCEALAALGWRQAGRSESGVGELQPRYLFQLDWAGRDLEEVWSGLSKRWRRDIRRAGRQEVTTSVGGYPNLEEFHRLLRATERRKGFNLGRSLSYYQRQYRAMTAEGPERMRLYLAHHEGRLLAAHTLNTVGRHSWYQLGASSDEGRRVHASHALQWQMMRDAHRMGCELYDMGGVHPALDPADPTIGVLRWKLGTGGSVVETAGEWEFALNGLWDRAVNLYLTRR